MADIDKLTKDVLKFRNDREWAQFHNPKDVSISLALEAAELLEHFQWKTPEEIAVHIKTGKEEISDELADVLYWVLLLSRDLDIDISKALGRKLRKNAKKYPLEKSRGKITKYNKL
ncbi:MAG: nucleotide pyrophosphohydrolase [Elusimicrobia bacterium CG1_02_56_21]|nr:MAG: nucleotide pyrophosphohydrolase [Elusimicrobia bacterium CG1_02_56_21]